MNHQYSLRSRSNIIRTLCPATENMASNENNTTEDLALVNLPATVEIPASDTVSINSNTDTQGGNAARIQFNALLPEFHGKSDENVEYFFAQFEQVAQIAGWPKTHLTIILKSKLRGDAQNLVSNDRSMQVETSYDNLKEMILDHFFKQKSMLQKYAEFNQIVQTPNLTVKQLAQKIKSAAKVYFDYGDKQSTQEKSLIEKLLLTKFCDALRSDIRFELRKFNPTNLEEAIEKSQLIEEANNDRAISVSNVNAFDTNLQMLEIIKKQAELQEQKFTEIQAQINNIKATPAPDTQKKTNNYVPPFCYFCGMAGHFMNACWHFLATQTQQNSNATIPQVDIHNTGRQTHFNRSHRNFKPYSRNQRATRYTRGRDFHPTQPNTQQNRYAVNYDSRNNSTVRKN